MKKLIFLFSLFIAFQAVAQEGIRFRHCSWEEAKAMAKKEKKLPDCIEKMGGMSEITTKKLSIAAKEGDAFAKKVFAKSGEQLGKGLSIIIDILNPEMIVLGGVFMRSSELLIPTMEKVLKKETLGESLRVCRIVPAQLSENIGDIAALALGDL